MLFSLIRFLLFYSIIIEAIIYRGSLIKLLFKVIFRSNKKIYLSLYFKAVFSIIKRALITIRVLRL